MIEERIENETLLSWHWLVNSTNNKRFNYFQPEAHFSHSGFFAETLTKNLQLHLLCLYSSQFKNNIRKTPRPSGLL